jgi:hypothetical protein
VCNSRLLAIFGRENATNNERCVCGSCLLSHGPLRPLVAGWINDTIGCQECCARKISSQEGAWDRTQGCPGSHEVSSQRRCLGSHEVSPQVSCPETRAEGFWGIASLDPSHPTRLLGNPFGRNSIGDPWICAGAQKPHGTGPPPLIGPCHQAASDRIHVEVLDHPRQRFRLRDVAIVTAAGLPEEPLRVVALTSRDAR